MLGVLKFITWTACAVGLGIFLARAEIDGRTPIEHAQRAWNRPAAPSSVDQLKGGLRDAIDGAKQTVSEKTKKPPHGSYLDEERAAIDRLIAGGR
jgi:hypothetical protein